MANTRITQGVIKPNENYLAGIITAQNINVTGVLTYEDVTNVDSIGVITARKGIVSSGVVTATAFHGDGSQLSGIDKTVLTDPAGNIKIQAQASGAMHTGFSTMQNLRVTGIATFGTSSTVINGDQNIINVGTALTLGHSQGVQFHTQNLHADGFEINNINASGIITASQFSGNGSNLSGLPVAIGTALGNPGSGLDSFFYVNKVLPVNSTVTVDPPSSSDRAYTHYTDIQVSDSADLIIAEGDDLIPDVLGLANNGTFGGGSSTGRLRVNIITDKNASGAPTVSNGLVISGVTTTSDIKVGTGATLNVYGGATYSGIVTATSFRGDGSQLTGISVDTTKIETGNTKVETIDTGSDGHIKVTTEGTVQARITSSGHVSIGHDGDVDTSNGNIGKKFGIRSTANNFIIGETTQTGAGYGLHLEGRQTGRSGGARITQISMRNDSSGNGEINFQTAQTGSDVTERCTINAGGHFHPHLNATYDLGISGKAWRNLYVNDAHFSNEGHSNSVDGTWGSWTLQEGENDIFMINNRTGKKYAITMRKVE